MNFFGFELQYTLRFLKPDVQSAQITVSRHQTI